LEAETTSIETVTSVDTNHRHHHQHGLTSYPVPVTRVKTVPSISLLYIFAISHPSVYTVKYARDSIFKNPFPNIPSMSLIDLLLSRVREYLSRHQHLLMCVVLLALLLWINSNMITKNDMTTGTERPWHIFRYHQNILDDSWRSCSWTVAISLSFSLLSRIY
jgi:hypothetical protein